MIKEFKHYFRKKKLGIIIASIGVGVVITVVIPIWGWVLTVGAGLVYCGLCLIKNSHCR